jgi:C1A family cysteine protease
MPYAYGWRQSPPDMLDQPADLVGLPIHDEVDPRGEMPAPYDQGQLGSCTANAIAGAVEYDAILDDRHFGTPSRLFLYFEERKRERTTGTDSGAYGRDGFKVLRKEGVPPETDWPYDITRFTQPPPASAYVDARANRIPRYVHPGLGNRNAEDRKDALKRVLSNKQTVAFGFIVFESFESAEVAKTGIVPQPEHGEKVVGGHEVLLIGYLKDEPEYALCRNSWGEGWGIGGYFLLPWSYLLNAELASDFRSIYRPKT